MLYDKSQSRLPMNRIIWDRSGNPTRYVSDELRIEWRQLHQALHKIKAYNNLGATDRTVIYDDGEVTDANGDPLGNIFDEDTHD
jgi:DNA-directed RNA polymerase specialized sigma subunit